MNLFSMDNLFFRTVGKLTDLVWVNLLTLFCALPVVTAGASLTAMYSVLLKMARNEEGHLTKSFFAAFRDNWKNATKIWLVTLLILAVYAADLRLLSQGVMQEMGTMGKVSGICITIVLLGVIIILQYAFPMLARYDNSLKGTLKNAVLVAGAFLPRTVCMLVIWMFPVALMLLSNYFLWLWFLYGLTFPGYLCAQLLMKIFERMESR